MRYKMSILIFLFFLVINPAHAEEPTTLADVVRKTISENPEVQATWYAFLSSTDEQDVARGGFFPRLDLSAGTGWERWSQANRADEDFTRSNVTLSLRQMVYDGFATSNEVKRLGYAKLVRYYEVLAASEQVGLEAMRAYLDVLRYRELQKLATDNFAQHQSVFGKVQERVKAGVGRGVDGEQAAGRLALSEANRVTETSNLYDVSTRYLRIVGSAPPSLAPQDILRDGIPGALPEALELAFQESPPFNAAVENVRAAEAAVAVRNAAFHPRVDLQARQTFSEDIDAMDGRKDETVAEIVLRYNLFAGGSDLAAKRQYLQRLDMAKSLREKACRDLRQTLSIAFNDMEKLQEQLIYLNEHQITIGKARMAYKDQFDIGQRTLLDLLDTENEYFEARRAYVNASYDYALAHGRTLAAMGRLLKALGVSREALPSPEDVGQDRQQIDPDSICPAVVVEKVVFVRPEDTTTVVDPSPEVLLQNIPYEIKVEFPFDSVEIRPEYKAEIARMTDFLRQHPELKLTIGGHTDNIGTALYNQKLSQGRAEAVARRLVEHGVESERLNTVGFGLTRPIADNTTLEGRSRNRRVEAVSMAD
ncbi:MAG: TolC family outer membrane protein [Desulfoarculaceae bacterium]|nr:TolC family outer membrane protein [Desulfoarculaceae bacterium]